MIFFLSNEVCSELIKQRFSMLMVQQNVHIFRASIFVFAAGNGGFLAKDSCAYNGYVNSIYTIAITGLNRAGSVPSYGERCPGIMAAAYSRNTFGERNPLVSSFTYKNKFLQ